MEFENQPGSIRVRLVHPLTGQQSSDLEQRLRQLPEVTVIGLSDAEITLQFYPQVVSEQQLREAIHAAGGREAPEKKKGVLSRFIERLGRENQANTGGSGYSCCDLPGKDQPSRE